MRVLVTGGAGFIGANLVSFLVNEKNHKVLTVDKLTYAGKITNLSEVIENPAHQFKQIDILDKEDLRAAIFEFAPDWIMHLAAESHVDRSINDANDFVSTNIIGSHILAEATMEYLQQKSAEFKKKFKFIHVSTDEVFGSIAAPEKFSESSAYKPSSPYAATKAAADLLLRSYEKTYKLPLLIVNCSNNYGPYQYPEKLIPLCITNALAEKPLPIYGNGLQVRDWLYVKDHVQALVMIAEKGKVGERYCIGGNNERTNIEVVKAICHILDELSSRRNGKSYIDLIQHVTDRAAHDLRYAIDASKIKTELGWKPMIHFAEGLQSTVAWYLKEKGLNHVV